MSAPKPQSAAVSEQATVLLVDDQPMVGEALRRALLSEPMIAFHYCGDPAEALSTARSIKPTVILQDLIMPEVNGLDLVRQYRADPATAGIPIIVLSSREEPTVKSQAFAVGANDYLVKLPDEIELIARIRYHSMAYLVQIQRDEAYRALRESQRQLVEKNLELERLTHVDGLTGLSNRRFFNGYLDSEWSRGIRSAAPLSLLMVDVDHFKQYNDTYGHIAGDEVLKQIATVLRASCRRSTDLAARFGGEEFVVVLPETPFAQIQRLADKLCGAVEALDLPHSTSAVGACVTISIGGASVTPTRDGDYFDLLETADKALYEAKRSGKNRAVTRDLAVASTPST